MKSNYMVMKVAEYLKRSIVAFGMLACSYFADISQTIPAETPSYQARYFNKQLFLSQPSQPPEKIINMEALKFADLPKTLEHRKRLAVVDLYKDLFAEISHGDYTSYITEAALENEEVIRIDIGKHMVENNCYGLLGAGFVACANRSVAEAIDEAVETEPDIISLSIGISWGSMLPVLRKKGCVVNDTEYNIGKIGMSMQRGMEKGIVFVASAGNESSASRLAYPACIDGVFSSGALKKEDDEWKIASFSNREGETYFFPPGLQRY